MKKIGNTYTLNDDDLERFAFCPELTKYPAFALEERPIDIIARSMSTVFASESLDKKKINHGTAIRIFSMNWKTLPEQYLDSKKLHNDYYLMYQSVYDWYIKTPMKPLVNNLTLSHKYNYLKYITTINQVAYLRENKKITPIIYTDIVGNKMHALRDVNIGAALFMLKEEIPDFNSALIISAAGGKLKFIDFDGLSDPYFKKSKRKLENFMTIMSKEKMVPNYHNCTRCLAKGVCVT